MNTKLSYIVGLKNELRSIEGHLRAMISTGKMFGVMPGDYIRLSKRYKENIGLANRNGQMCLEKRKKKIQGDNINEFGLYQTSHLINIKKAAMELRRQGITSKRLEKKLEKLGKKVKF